MPSAHVSLGDVVAALGGVLHGDAAQAVGGIASLTAASPQHLSFVTGPERAGELAASRAGCVVAPPALQAQALARGSAIITPNPYLYHARLTQWWRARTRPAPTPGVHASASVGTGVHLHPSAHVGAFAVLGDGVHVGEGAVVGAHSVVEAGARLGAGSWLAPRVVVGAGCVLGARCRLQSGAVIGADGFGYAPDGGQWVRIEQLGSVRLGDDVDVGANTCIDRGALDDTVLEDGVKLDNQIQIAHNVHIGAHTAMAGCVGVAGSARIGRHCTFGGAAMVLGHLEIADHVHIGAASVVSRSIRQPGRYSGFFPLDENTAWEKNAATLKHLHQLRQRVRLLETTP